MQRQDLIKRFMKADGRLSNIAVYAVFYMVATVLGLAYITQTELVFEPRSTTEGYIIIAAVITLVGYKVVSWRKSRGK